jgi:hypothetical protein
MFNYIADPLKIIVDLTLWGVLLPLSVTGPYGSWIYNYLYMQSVAITTNVASSNPAHGEVYSIQHYVIKFVSDLRQVGGFLRVLRFPPPIKLIALI